MTGGTEAGGVEIRVRLSGAFDRYFSATPVAKGEDGHGDPPLLHTAYAQARQTKTGKGYYKTLTFRGNETEAALQALMRHAETAAAGVADAHMYEHRAAKEMVERCVSGLRRFAHASQTAQ